MRGAGGAFRWAIPPGQHRSHGSVVIMGLAVGAATLLGAAGIAVGIAADAPGASAAQVVRTAVRYACRFPAGTYPVSVKVTATFTPTAEAGRRIEPIGLRLAAQLPAGVDAGRLVLGAAAGALTVVEASRGTSIKAAWPVVGRQQAPGTLTLGATAPAVVALAPGLVTFAAGNLVVNLRFGKAYVRVACATGRVARFAAVMVSAAKPSGPARHARRARPASRSGIPKHCGDIKVTGPGVATCAYVTGYSDVAKLIGAALLQPRPPAKQGLVNVAFAEKATFKPGELIEKSAGELFYRGHRELPPITATFLAFRFVPVTATLHLTELTTIAIRSISGTTALPYPITVRTRTKIGLRVTNVRVNGMPLNVGPSCRTASPITLVLIGKGQNQPLRGYTVPTGGPLLGEATVPPFTGCGVTENLDPLLTGSISGRGNFVRFIQGELCAPSQPSLYVCPPPRAKPRR